jgi:3-oxoadipate enol-lactonase
LRAVDAPSEGFGRVENGRLFYERAGEGFPIVLLPPTLWDRRIWDPQFTAFAEQHDVVRYDLRGSGRSDRASAPYSDVRDLRMLLDGLGIERCALVGCSLGGQIAIDLAVEEPERVEALVVESPGLSGHHWGDGGVTELSRAVDRAIRMGDLRKAMELELAVWTPPGRWAEGDAIIRTVAMDNLEILRVDGELIEPSPSAVEHLGEISAAVLVVVGHDDIGEVHAIADEIAAGVPGATKRVIADADHLPHVRRPETFNRIVLDFLSFRM